MPTTSTPIKLGKDPSGNEHVDVSPVKFNMASQQADISKDTSLFLNSYADWLHEENRRYNTQGEEGSDWQDNYTKCDICGTCCRIASHLRRSDDCLRQLKLKPNFRFQGADNNEVFIIKTALLIGECPSPRCPTGQHSEIPLDCVSWWKSDGWGKMKWRGNREGADRYTIQERIRKFTNYHHMKNRQSQTQSETQATPTSLRDAPTNSGTSFNENGSRCSSCSEEGHLMRHLEESVQCLNSYAEYYLGEDEVDSRRTIFRLSIILNLCANRNCPDRIMFEYLGAHLNKNEECLEFYQEEGAHLALWDRSVSSRIISKKVAHLKRIMKQNKEKEQTCGYITYGKELTQLLAHVCCRCGSMGPVGGKDGFTMRGGWTYADGESEALWFCTQCTEESPEYEEFLQKLKANTDRLKGPSSCHQNAIKIVKSPTSSKLIVAPVCLVEDSIEASEVAPSLSTTVLVPFDGLAIRTIIKCCDEAAHEKEELKAHSEDLLSRPFLTEFKATLSCLYRSLLADLRTKMNRISLALSKGARGEIISLNPNLTSARKTKPNINMTTPGALRDLCNWSLDYEQQKSMESEAIAQMNGRVKIHIDGTIMNGLQDKNLRRILLLGYQSFEQRNVNSFEELENNPALLESFIASMSPVILKYIRAKARLFIKHIVAPNFSEYNLRLEIADEGLQVQIQGFIYTKQFNQVNEMLAEAPEIELVPEIIRRVTNEKNILPTTTLDWKYLCNNYKLEELRAKRIIEIVEHCQSRNVASPLSLITLWTPSGWNVSEKEKVLRFRAEQLSQEVNSDDNVEEAIIAITKSLLDEGLFEEVMFEEVDREIRQSLKESLSEVCDNQDPLSLNALLWYHTLLLRTGGSNQWTLRRGSGETLIIPYHPLLLEALEEQVEVKIAMEGEHLQVKLNQSRSELMAGTAWREISLLKFLNGISFKNYEELTSQCVVSVIASQQQEYNFRDSNEKDEECDDIYTNSKGESFIVTNGDLKKLYMKRPPSMHAITLAQFAITYYKTNPSQPAIIDTQTGVGRETGQAIVGGGDLSLPMYMRLSNGVIMKKRSDPSRHALLLLKYKETDDYGSRLMFQPWSTLEELAGNQNDEDKEIQGQNCRAMFPMAEFLRKKQQ